MKNKKSAFNISIQAIVVLILAITLLGLGLTFLRNFFGNRSLNETYFEQENSCSKNLYINELKDLPKCSEDLQQKFCLSDGHDNLNYNYTYVHIDKDIYVVVNCNK